MADHFVGTSHVAIPYLDPATVVKDVNLVIPFLTAGVALLPGAEGNSVLAVLGQLLRNQELLTTVVNAINTFSAAAPPTTT